VIFDPEKWVKNFGGSVKFFFSLFNGKNLVKAKEQRKKEKKNHRHHLDKQIVQKCRIQEHPSGL
jgi:hypothetical protein